MMRKFLPSIASLACILVTSQGLAQEPESNSAIRIRLGHPDEQLREILNLFKEAKAPNPAAALAAWKRASREPNRLGKPLEALIAALNPRMIDELKTLDGAEVSIRFDPTTGKPEWSAILPKDDGTFNALATALALSGGAAESPMGEVAVDRLAGPGSPLMARIAGGTLVADSRRSLKLARDRVERPHDLIEELRPENKYFNISFDPGSLNGTNSIGMERLAEVISYSKKKPRPESGSTDLNLGLQSGLLFTSLTQVDFRRFQRAEVDPSWLDWTPKDRAMVSFALTTDPTAKSWDELFGLADRIEKLDPARADVASIKLRLDLMARLAGFRAEADLLHHLKGISGWVGADGKAINVALLLLHLDDQPTAERFVTKVKPLPVSAAIPVEEVGRPRTLGQIDGKTLRISQIGRSVALSWGEGVLEASIDARDHPERSAGPLMGEVLTDNVKSKPTLSGLLWPGRIPGAWPEGSPLSKAMILAPPLVWNGYWDQQDDFSLFACWPELDQTIKRFLELIPLDPPRDH